MFTKVGQQNFVSLYVKFRFFCAKNAIFSKMGQQVQHFYYFYVLEGEENFFI